MFSTRLLLFVMIASCGILAEAAPPENVGDAKVMGLITFRGKPVVGKISLFRNNGQFVGSKIADDGTYVIDQVPLGELKVTIEGKDVPAKYTSDEITPLVVNVKVGKNQLNFELQ